MLKVKVSSIQTVLLPYSDATLFGFVVQGETTEDVKLAGKAVVQALKGVSGNGGVKAEDVKKAVAKAKFEVASSVDGRIGFMSTLGPKVSLRHGSHFW